MITVAVVFATADCQEVLELEVDSGTTLIEVVDQSGIGERFADHDLENLRKGVWGKVKPDDYVVEAGDRVEIYRPLIHDPKEARRQRARQASG